MTKSPRRNVSAAWLILALAACGGDDDGDANLCPEMAEPVATIETYPGGYVGATAGGGADLSVAEGTCAEEPGGWYEPIGDDVVVALRELTPGARYGAVVRSSEDLGLYIVTGCQPENAGPAAGECLVFNDATTAGEASAFTAPESGEAWVVIDSANLGGAPPTGAFELTVVEAECETSEECSAPTPACVNFQCVECATSFDCADADEPLCDATNACAAGTAECTGDDAADDDAGGDDGPAAATELAPPAADTPTVVEAAVCSLPASEQDWYSLEVTATGRYGFELASSGENDIDVYVLDAAGAIVTGGVNEDFVGEAFAAELDPGSYYVVVLLYDPADQAESAAYTLTVRQAECETSFDCGDPAESTCSPAAACQAGPADCADDDAGDDGAGDDGPAAARDLSGAVGVAETLTGAVCSSPAAEGDFYAVTVTAGQGLDLELSWDTADDLDIQVYDAEGNFLGASFWLIPESVSLTYLPAGTYYVRVSLFTDEPVTASMAYTISATTTTAQVCSDASDCAAAYSNQIYRGDCTGGVCAFLEGDGAVAAGDPCDSFDDCDTEICSYIAYEADAHLSVCTDVCTGAAECDAIAAGLTCTTGLQTNICLPTCGQDLDCGAATNSEAIDADQPWDYYTCDEGSGACTFGG